MRSVIWFLAGAIALIIVVYGDGFFFLETHANGFSARAQPSVIESWAARRTRAMALPAGARERANPVADSPETLARKPASPHFFSLTNFSGAQTNGAVQAQFFMGAPYYVPAENTVPWLVKLENGETGTGVLTLTPPAPGKSLSLVLFYYTAPNVVARAEMLVDVAARYKIRLSGFKAKTLRGQDHDELHIIMSLARPDSHRCSSGKVSYCFLT